MAEEKKRTEAEKYYAASIQELRSIRKASTGFGSTLREYVGTSKTIFGTIAKFIGAFSSMGPKFETMGAKFSTSFANFRDDAEDLAKSLEAPAHVYDGFIMQLQANRLGLNTNNKALQDLFSAIIVTGEDWVRIQNALFGATVGTAKSTKSMGELADTVDNSSKVFNMTREELAQALGALSRNTINLISATQGQNAALQGAVVNLQGLIPDQRLFTQAVQTLEKQFTMKGLTESIAMGFPVDELLGPGAEQTRVIEAMLDMGKKSRDMLTGQGRQLIFQQAALKGAFGDVSAKAAIRDQIIDRAISLGIKNAGELTNKQLAKELNKQLKAEQKTNKLYKDTWDMIKKSFVVPLINSFSEFFLSFKNTFGAENIAGLIKGLLLGIGEGIIFLGELVLKGIDILGDQFGGGLSDSVMGAANSLKSMRKSLTDIKTNTKNTTEALDPDKPTSSHDKLVNALDKNSRFNIHQLYIVNKRLGQVVNEIQKGNDITKRKDMAVTVVTGGEPTDESVIKRIVRGK